MAGEIAAAGAGMQAQQRGSTTRDLSSAFAAFLGGMRQRDREREAQALEEAKLAVEQRNADSNAVNAAANMMHGRANVMNAENQAQRTQFYLEHEGPAAVAAQEANAAYLTTQSDILNWDYNQTSNAVAAWDAELMTYGIPESVRATYRGSPLRMKEYVESQREMFHRRMTAMGSAGEPVAEHIRLMQTQLQTATNEKAQADQALISYVDGLRMSPQAVIDPETGEQTTFLAASMKDPVQFQRLIATDPNYRMLAQRAAETESNYTLTVQNAQQAGEYLNGYIRSILEGVDGQVGRSLGAATSGSDYMRQYEEAGGPNDPYMRGGNMSGGLDQAFPGGAYDRLDTPLSPGAGERGHYDNEAESAVPQAPPAAVDSMAQLGTVSPETLAAILPTVQRAFPNVDRDLAARGLSPDTLLQIAERRTNAAFDRAARELENYNTPGVLMRQGPEPALKAIRETLSRARLGENSEDPSVTNTLIANAKTLSSMGMSAADAERSLTRAQINNPVWEYVKARWPTRIGGGGER